MYPLFFHFSSFAYSLLAFASAYALRVSVDPPLRLFYVSGILNSPSDSLDRFAVRWSLWLLLASVLFSNLAPFLPLSVSLLVPVSFVVCIATGFDFRVLGGPKPSDLLFYSHSAATGLVMLTSVYTLYRLGFRFSAYFWLVVSACYGGLYFARLFIPFFDYPPESFMITEYVFFFYFAFCVSVSRPLLSRTFNTR